MTATSELSKKKAPFKGLSKIDFHGGNMLSIAASRYPNLKDFVLEVVQNAIDAEPIRISIRIDLEKRILDVADDGEGATQEKMELGLSRIAQSLKGERKDKFGQFGLGLISPLNKCSRFTFTSRPEGSPYGYLTWMFDSEAITKQHTLEGIPLKERPDLYHEQEKGRIAKKGFTAVWWRTQVKVFDITRDKLKSRLKLDELCEDILDRYGSVIKQRDIKVTIRFTDEMGQNTIDKDIVATGFQGTQLPPFVDTDKEAGNVVFDLYLARKTASGRKGSILFGVKDNPFRLPAKNVAPTIIPFFEKGSGVVEAITSGLFEGEIICDKLLLEDNRKRFVEDDALMGLCVALECWFKQIGQSYVEETMTQNRDKRLQELGVRSINVIDTMLKDPEWAEMLREIERGTIGSGHAKVRVLGEQSESALSNRGGSLQEREKPGSSGEPNGEQDRERGELTSHHPASVAGPAGKPRSVVKGSKGIQFQFVELLPTSKVYEFDERLGTIAFNVRNPWFSICEERESDLMKYLETVAQMALMLFRYRESESLEAIRQYQHDLLKMSVFSILNSDVLSGRRKGNIKSVE